MTYATAIGSPQRWIKARMVAYDLTLEALIETIEVNHTLIPGSSFEIGTAPAASLKAVINEDGTLALYDFSGKEFRLDLSVNTGTIASPVFDYLTIGYFTIEEAKRESQKITLNATDRMYKFNVFFEDNLTYPASLDTILDEICAQAGVTRATTTFANMTFEIASMSFYRIQLRQMLSAIAELAGGYAIINASGEVEILTLDLNDLSPKVITDENIYLDGSKIEETALTLVEQVVVQTGEQSASVGSGATLTILNNLFAQRPDELAQGIYDVLNGLSYTGIALAWQGDFALPMGKYLQVESGSATMYSYLFNRVLKFDGGLSEQSSAPAESAIVRNNPIQGSLKLEVERALAEIRVAKAEIELLTQQTTDLGDDVASILIEVDSIKNTVSSHTGQISQLTQDVDGLTLEITSVDEDLQQVKTVFQETADGFVISKTVNVGGTETKTASISSIFEGGVTPVLIIDDGSNETAKIYANNIDISNGRFVNSLTAGTHKITHYTKDGVDWTIFQKITRG